MCGPQITASSNSANQRLNEVKLDEKNEIISQLKAQFKIQSEIIEEMKEALEQIAIEQELFIRNKDYFSEVVRLNLTAKEALESITKKLGEK